MRRFRGVAIDENNQNVNCPADQSQLELSLSHIEVNRWPPFLLSGYVNLDWGKT